MKTLQVSFLRRTQPRPGAGFTIVELLTVMAMLVMLAMVLLPALAHTRPNISAAQCWSNLRQMQTGGIMYSTDFGDTMLPNAPLGTTYAKMGWIGLYATVNWNMASGNTNVMSILTNTLAPYVQYQIKVYKCPGDIVPSLNGQRLRSYSMNSQMGILPGWSINYNLGWRTYAKMSDLTAPIPSQAFVFSEENMCNMNDGFLQVDVNTPRFPDVPGSYHDGSGTFSFADGHAEVRPWETPALQIPVRFGYTAANLYPASGGNADWLWLRERCAARK